MFKVVNLYSDNFKCSCGNAAHLSGFHACNIEGNYLDTDESTFYKCDKCKQIYLPIHNAKRCECHGMEPLCNDCGGIGYLPNVHAEAMKHLRELDAFIVPNPIVSKSIAMRRLIEAGISDYDAQRAIDQIFANR